METWSGRNPGVQQFARKDDATEYLAEDSCVRRLARDPAENVKWFSLKVGRR
jgi:hypothetical protein